jgi:sigma-54 dependent transcriptional regulator, acetoin dehydrogenase operon transcriptional activator AcoR
MLFNVEVQETIKQITKSISAVLNVEVIVADKNFNIVGGTAKHQGDYRIDYNGIYSTVLKTGKTIILENPGYNQLCKRCHLYQKCPETMEIDCPIKYNNNIIGIISLVGLTKKHKELLLSKKRDYAVFLERMSELITNKVNDIYKTKEINFIAQQLEHVVNNVSEGFIMTDENGSITYGNHNAKKLLELSINILGKKIYDIAPSSLLVDAIAKKSNIEEREYSYVNAEGKFIRCYIKFNTIICNDNNTKGFIATIRDVDDVKKSSLNLLGESQKYTKLQDIKGKSEKILRIKEQVLIATKSTSTVLIQGATGTGKGIIARAIHYNTVGREGPFVVINCSAIPAELLESELFGYEEGAFTGAKKGGKIGKFELANKGTIFLDEIGDMQIYMQSKLLRVLDSKKIQRVGGLKEIDVDIRILAATNKDLHNLVLSGKGQFREDLYYRLNVIPIFMPTLSERKEDIQGLVKFLLTRYNYIFKKNIKGLDSKTNDIFMSYPWPGNVRELENIIEYCMNVENDTIISYHNLPQYLKIYDINNNDCKNSLKSILDKYEKEILYKKKKEYGHTSYAKKLIADELDLSMPTLYRKWNFHDIDNYQK